MTPTQPQPWHERASDRLFAPAATLSRPARRWITLAAALLTALWCTVLNGPKLPDAWSLPDVYFYGWLAAGKASAVPQPFSSRLLAPLLARGIAAVAGQRSYEFGFGVVAYVSLCVTLLIVFSLLLRSAAPRWTLLAVAAVPFWPQLLGDAGLPDPLSAALLAGLLLTLERGWFTAAALLLFPLMLARESTALTLLCLLLVGARQLRWVRAALAVASAGVSALLVRHLSAGGLPNPEHLPGPVYLAGKVAANALRSTGVVPWSNVYPELCPVPGWQMPLHVGAVRSVGVCTWSPVAPVQALMGLLVTFGVLPALLLLRRDSPRPMWAGHSLLVRFCLLYGGASLLLAPALGTWYARLFGYGWPLPLVALPRLLGEQQDSGIFRAFARALLVVHLLVCGLGVTRLDRWEIGGVVLLQAIAIALLLMHTRRAEGSNPGV